MAYSFDLLTTVPQCDELLALTDAELRDLQHRADNFDYALGNTADDEAARTRRLTVVDAQITAFNTIATALPDGDEKNRNATDLRRATARRAELLDRTSARGPVTQLQREADVVQLTLQIGELTTFRAGVAARKAVL